MMWYDKARNVKVEVFTTLFIEALGKLRKGIIANLAASKSTIVVKVKQKCNWLISDT